jgi:chromosome segregation ATPase
VTARNTGSHKPQKITPLEWYGATSSTAPEKENSSALLNRTRLSLPSSNDESHGKTQATHLKAQMRYSDAQMGLPDFGGASADTFSRIGQVKIQAQREKLDGLEAEKQKKIGKINEYDLKIEELQNQIAAAKENKMKMEADMEDLTLEIFFEKGTLDFLETKVQTAGLNAADNAQPYI